VRPDWASGLQAGFSLRHDNLTVPGPNVAETIAIAHGVFLNGKYEILNEGMLVRHIEPSGPVYRTSGFYSQWSRGFGKWRPYFRYQYFNAPDNDPVWMYASPNQYDPLSDTNFVGRLKAPAWAYASTSRSIRRLSCKMTGLILCGLESANEVTSQVAFTFRGDR
jgi:hypothetical protein